MESKLNTDVRGVVKLHYQVQEAAPDSYRLAYQNYGHTEIEEMVKVLLSDRLTMGKHVSEFEKAFAAYVGVPYAVMVNSGSSANLLAVSASTNSKRTRHLVPGDAVAIPAVCWSTSLAPLVQMGLRPVLPDVDVHTYNMDITSLEETIQRENIRGIMAVHILGNCTAMNTLMKICEAHDLILIEDTCESLGSRYKGQTLGTFGDFGTFSFYFSHHITTMEGGMIVCKQKEDAELVKSLRAHGWTRDLARRREIEVNHADIDPRFLFLHCGYNLRPMEIQGAMGKIQLKSLEEHNHYRKQNEANFRELLQKDQRNKHILIMPHATDGCDVAWFALCFSLSEEYQHHYNLYLAYLTKHNVENRPLVTGNILRQPFVQELNLGYSLEDYPGAEQIHKTAFFIGNPPYLYSESKLQTLLDILLNYEFQKKL